MYTKKSKREIVEYAARRQWALRGADLHDANLNGANLSGADLSGANLHDAYLRWANLSGANLSGADLSGANLRWANLEGADLEGANLSDANLNGANLSGADLSGANLSGANLRWTDLSDANLSDANLSGTILEPGAPMPETDLSTFELAEDGRLIGYRTQRSRYVGDTEYRAGETYTAPIFSICTKTDCHPGLYIYPLAQLPGEYAGYGVVKVLFRAEDALNAGDKYRCKSFEVVEVLKDTNV